MKYFLRTVLLSVALMLFGFSARAGSISEAQARAKAQSFLQSRFQTSDGRRGAPLLSPQGGKIGSTSQGGKIGSPSQGGKEGTPSLYVFNVGTNDGFVIVSGDDRTRPILGYADRGRFEEGSIPAGLREMLAIYARQIEMLGQTKGGGGTATASGESVRRISSTMADVAPLLTTTWDQGYPYNDYCPLQGDLTALTGCVATAVAQIVNYHKWPTTRVPSLASFVSETNKINVPAWGATTFDFANMLDHYDGTESSTQIAAVATLMRYCGQAAQMDYGFDRSGTYNGNALYAFTEKLGYPATAEFKSAGSYSANAWEDLIYKEVSQGRPVYYSALNGDEGGPQCGGHAFVIDGYQADGNFFHVNWGWGGALDGYFNLFALDPYAPESAPTATGWHYQMLALVGLSPEGACTATLTRDASGSWLITSANDWNELSTNLEAYNGGTFKLTQDIIVSTMVGTAGRPFSGTFDGQGHTLTVNIESNEEYAAPFHYAVNSTFSNLTVAGTINVTEHFAGGVIGWAQDVTLQGCESRVTINSNYWGDGTHGGFISIVRGGTARFYDCMFSGAIIGEHTHHCGGFCGWRDGNVEMYNCLNMGRFQLESASGSATFSRNGCSLVNSYYISSFANAVEDRQGASVTADELASGSITRLLQDGSREWTTGLVWGQKLGTDTVPQLTSDASKGVYKVSFAVDGQVMRTVVTNSPIGDKMPSGEDFGLTNATFTANGAPFTSTTVFTSDITVHITGTSAYTLTLSTPANGTISINNNVSMPGTLKKITALPASGYKVKAVTATDATGHALPVTPVSNNAHEFVFAFPKSSVTVNAEFEAGEAEAVRFINGGLMLPLWNDQPWTADTWTIWANDYQPLLGTPPADALGHQWYEPDYALTNSDADVQPNGSKIVWENHTAPFGNGRNYDYARACGAPGDGPNNFYMRRVFTFNTETAPERLYLRCNYDDAPVQVYINGTLVYNNPNSDAGGSTIQLTPEQTALIHTDGTPNVLAAKGSQGGGDYYLDCGLYDPTALSYTVNGESTLRVLRNEYLTGDVVIPETVTASGKTYTVTELPDNVTNDLPYMTSMSIPSTVNSIGTGVFRNNPRQVWVKSYIPVLQDNKVLVAAPLAATDYELPEGCERIWNNAFKFTEQLTKLTLPRSLTYIGYNAFVGCTALTDIYSYTHPAPSTERNAFEGIDKSKITVHVYASALESYKASWGEEFQYVTMADPQPLTLTIDVADRGSLRSLIEAAAAEQGGTLFDVTGITVTGNLNQDDLRTLAAMCTGVYALATINLGAAHVEGNYIGNDMFRSLEKLTAITLPETLEYINGSAFNNCPGLTAIHIPASVKRIGSYAFDNCPILTTVTGCEGLTDTEAWRDWYVFGWTPSVEGDVYGGTTFLSLDVKATGEYEVPAGIKVIVGGAMHGRNITSVVIPASVTDLGNDVFRGCHQLTDFYVYAPMPPVCHDGSMEYDYDKSQATLHVPAPSLADYQNADEWREFGRIVGMATGELVDMSIHVAAAGTLNDELFDAAVAEAEISDKTLIRSLTVTGSINADDVAYLNALPNTLYYLEQLDLSGTTLEGATITERMFYQSQYKSIALPDGVTRIETEAFSGSRRLHDITLPDALEYIGPYAFAGTSLTSIVIPDGVSELGHRGLQSCAALTSITVGNGVTAVPECWAENCGNLQEVTLGKKVQSVGRRAFPGNRIQTVSNYAYMPPSWNDSFYDGINSEAVLHVYENSQKRYSGANGWSNFPAIVGDLGTYPTFDLTVNVAEMGTFSEALAAAMAAAGCEDWIDIDKLTITGNMNSSDVHYIRDHIAATLNVLDLGGVTMEHNTMYDHELRGGLFETLILPAHLEYFADWYDLAGCVNLKTIHIPSSVKRICPNFLYGATSLETVTGGEGVTEMDEGNGMYFDNCPNLQHPVILGNIFFRLPLSTTGAYEVPENVTAIARDAMWNVDGLTSLTLSENVTVILGNAFSNDHHLKDIYYRAVELPRTSGEAFNNFDRAACTLHVYEEMVEVFQNDGLWGEFNIVGDLGTMPVVVPMNEADYADLCVMNTALGGDGWRSKWITGKNVQTASRWRGITFDEEGYVTAIDLSGNLLSGDVSSLTFSGMTRLTSLNLNSNALTGDIQPLAASLPAGCKLYVENQDLGYIGEHTLYEVCQYGGLPSIAYWRSDAGMLAQTLIGVGGRCNFYHGTATGSDYYANIFANGGTESWNKFSWPSPAVMECTYPHRFTFTYIYEMGDANMDDTLNVLDLQSTLNYSNGRQEGLFNFHAADTYGQDDDINVQDIVTTVNILLSGDHALLTLAPQAPLLSPQGGKTLQGDQSENLLSSPLGGTEGGLRNPHSSPLGGTEGGLEGQDGLDGRAFLFIDRGQLVLYTTVPVAALDLRLSGIQPQQLKWNTESMGFATAANGSSSGTHAIIYSLAPRQIEEGRTVLATFDATLTPQLAGAVLSDIHARPVSVGQTVPTGIDEKLLGRGALVGCRLYDLSGRPVLSGTHTTEADILREARNRQLRGMFILETNGAMRKVIIEN